MAKRKRTVRVSFRFPRDVFEDLGRMSRREERTKTSIAVRAIRNEVTRSGAREADLLEKPVDAHPPVG